MTDWRIHDFRPGDGLRDGAHLADFDDADWLPIDVPGDVHRTLIEADRIAHPFDACNESGCAWMEQREWWYRRQFHTDDERLRLTFHGLDTFATVYVNGQAIGQHRNMFRPATFDITPRPGQNTLAVRFDP